jgi:hypothetical protein
VLIVAHRRPECTHAVQSDIEDTVHSCLARKAPLYGFYIHTLMEGLTPKNSIEAFDLEKVCGKTNLSMRFARLNITSLPHPPPLPCDIINTASTLGPYTQTDRGTCPGVGL